MLLAIFAFLVCSQDDVCQAQEGSCSKDLYTFNPEILNQDPTKMNVDFDNMGKEEESVFAGLSLVWDQTVLFDAYVETVSRMELTKSKIGEEIEVVSFEGGRPWANLTQALKEDGFVVVQDVLKRSLVKKLYERICQELGYMLGTIALSGTNTFDLFSFTEIVHRSKHRFDIQLLKKELWDPVISAIQTFLKPLFDEYLGPSERIRIGSVVALPGANRQKFHIDSPEEGFLGIFIPCVDITTQGTTLLAGTHLQKYKNPVRLKRGAKKRKFGGLIDAGSILVYDYRVVHRGNFNQLDFTRPMLYFTVAREGQVEKNNFPENKSIYNL